MSKSNSFVLGIVVGGVIGSIAMLLSTPKSGSELRSSIKVNSRDLSEKLTHLKNEAKDFLTLIETSTKEGTQVVKEFTEDVQKTISEWRRDIEPHQLTIQREMKEIEETLQQLEDAVSTNRHQVTE
ncbi:YtxH domain-containing protein [Bacillus sp. BGMRC 2118]|nr:YtxH domain-containing protein [Bacillus sp. BGMRC 2118]